MSRLIGALAMVALLLPSVKAEVQVNVRASGAQANASVAVDPCGGVVIVWSSYYSTAGRSNDIFARRLDANGVPTGEEFVVNTASEGNQTEPAAVINGQGRMAIVWQGPGAEEDVFLRLFDPQGEPVTEDLLVNLRSEGRQLYPCIATGGGRFIVAWESRETTPYGDQTFAMAQLFDPNGTGLGSEILIDPDVYDCRYLDAAMDAQGDFAVTWMRDRSSHPIMARLFDANGVPRAEAFAVNTAPIASVTRPSIAMNPSGWFIIAWDGDPNRASDDDIHARLYDPNGTPRGEPFVVNTLREGPQQWPRLAIGDANEFVVVWEADTGDPNAATDIFARRFAADGQPTGPETRLNTYTQDKQRYADAAIAADGSFFAVWESDGQDGSGYGIFAHAEPPQEIPTEPNLPSE